MPPPTTSINPSPMMSGVVRKFLPNLITSSNNSGSTKSISLKCPMFNTFLNFRKKSFRMERKLPRPWLTLSKTKLIKLLLALTTPSKLLKVLRERLWTCKITNIFCSRPVKFSVLKTKELKKVRRLTSQGLPLNS